MQVIIAHDGSEWSSICALCSSTRRLALGYECPWCRAVRYRYGSFFYPISDSDRHLFVNAKRERLPGYYAVNLSKEKS